MDWISLIGMVITSGLLVTILEFLYYKRFNKAIKKNEANSGDLDNQMKSITLGETYLERVKAIDEAQQKLLKQQQLMLEEQDAKRDEQWLKQKDVMDNILKMVESLSIKVDNIEEFLDGSYQDFINGKMTETKKKAVKVKNTNKN